MSNVAQLLDAIEDGDAQASELKHDLLAVDEVLDRLAEVDAQATMLLKLRYYSGLIMPQAAEARVTSVRSAEELL